MTKLTQCTKNCFCCCNCADFKKLYEIKSIWPRKSGFFLSNKCLPLSKLIYNNKLQVRITSNSFNRSSFKNKYLGNAVKKVILMLINPAFSSNRRRVVRQAPEEGGQVGRRRVQHRLHGSEPVRRSLPAAAVLPAATVSAAAAARVPGLIRTAQIRTIQIECLFFSNVTITFHLYVVSGARIQTHNLAVVSLLF